MKENKWNSEHTSHLELKHLFCFQDRSSNNEGIKTASAGCDGKTALFSGLSCAQLSEEHEELRNSHHIPPCNLLCCSLSLLAQNSGMNDCKQMREESQCSLNTEQLIHKTFMCIKSGPVYGVTHVVFGHETPIEFYLATTISAQWRRHCTVLMDSGYKRCLRKVAEMREKVAEMRHQLQLWLISYTITMSFHSFNEYCLIAYRC